MTRPDYVAVSDPTLNPQFRRRWEHPPPERRKGRAAATKGPLKKTRNGSDGAQSIPSGPFVKPFDKTAAPSGEFAIGEKFLDLVLEALRHVRPEHGAGDAIRRPRLVSQKIGSKTVITAASIERLIAELPKVGRLQWVRERFLIERQRERDRADALERLDDALALIDEMRWRESRDPAARSELSRVRLHIAAVIEAIEGTRGALAAVDRLLAGGER